MDFEEFVDALINALGMRGRATLEQIADEVELVVGERDDYRKGWESRGERLENLRSAITETLTATRDACSGLENAYDDDDAAENEEVIP